MHTLRFALPLLALSVLGSPALAQSLDEPQSPEDAQSLDDELPRREEPAAAPDPFASDAASREHFELTMGFLAGERRLSELTFASGSSDPRAAGLVAPFQAAPFDQALVLGLRWELRLVVAHVRMTAGFDLPFTRYAVPDTTRTYGSGEGEQIVTTRSVQPWELRFGIGVEHAFGPIVPFVDLIGAVHGVDATLAIDGVGEVGYGAVGFGFSIRPGLRLMTSDWLFVQTSAQIGIGAPVIWDAELSVGFWIG